MIKPFFWLHIKKAGGQSFRKTFSPPYVQTERIDNFRTFIALPKEQWNDVLNNYRVPLGEYDYKRTLFASKFLYSEDEFQGMYKFAIVRNPYERAVSSWKYLMRSISRKDIAADPKSILRWYNFDYFLEDIPRLWETKYDRHKATHTAPMWGDMTDENGRLLLDDVYKLENINERLPDLCKILGIESRTFEHINKHQKGDNFRDHYSKRSRRLVEKLYEDDIEKLGYTFD